jgi:hypothetical protein
VIDDRCCHTSHRNHFSSLYSVIAASSKKLMIKPCPSMQRITVLKDEKENDTFLDLGLDLQTSYDLVPSEIRECTITIAGINGSCFTA